MSVQNTNPVLDISRQALSIARILERLPPGNYTINVNRPERKSERWTVEVHRTIVALRELVDHGQEESNDGSVTVVTP